MQKRCFIYIRVSTQRQAEEGYSIPEQKERLEKYADAMDWKIMHTYIDGGYSGGNTDRPALQDMLREVERGNADIIIVDKIDRFARNLVDTVNILENVLRPHDVAFVSRAEAFDSSSQIGKFCLYILAMFAEMERTRIKERMADGKTGRAKEGKYKGGGHIPIGYDYDQSSGALVPNEYEAAQVREVFDLFNSRTAIHTIMVQMNKKGYRTKYGEWGEGTIRYMISNRVYLGEISHKGEWYAGLHKPIIEQAVFDHAQQVLKEREKTWERYRPGKRYRSPLGGLIWCERCMAKYQLRNNGHNKDGAMRAYYMCYSRAKSDPKMVKDPNCKNKTYRDRDLEKIVYEEIRKLKTDPSYYPAITQSRDNASQRKMLEKRVAQIDGQISRLMDLYMLGTIDVQAIQSKTTPLNNEKNALLAQIENLKDAAPKMSRERVLELVNMFETELAANDRTSGKLHDTIAEIIEHIGIDGEEVHIHWAF